MYIQFTTTRSLSCGGTALSILTQMLNPFRFTTKWTGDWGQVACQCREVIRLSIVEHVSEAH